MIFYNFSSGWQKFRTFLCLFWHSYSLVMIVQIKLSFCISVFIFLKQICVFLSPVSPLPEEVTVVLRCFSRNHWLLLTTIPTSKGRLSWVENLWILFWFRIFLMLYTTIPTSPNLRYVYHGWDLEGILSSFVGRMSVEVLECWNCFGIKWNFTLRFGEMGRLHNSWKDSAEIFLLTKI